MLKLSRNDLFTLEKYTEIRSDFRKKVMAHKKNRYLAIGPHATLYFEDRLTIQYQIQEMLRIEKIFEAEGIQEELDTYNPLIPDGLNLKATFMLEYDDPDERKNKLAGLLDIENKVWLKINDFEPVYPIADEDLERSTGDKTSSVHFLRFEFSRQICESLKNGATLSAGIEHKNYFHAVDPVPDNIKTALIADIN